MSEYKPPVSFLDKIPEEKILKALGIETNSELNDFEIKRIQYIISQLEKKVTYTSLGLGDAEILKKLLQAHYLHEYLKKQLE